MEKRSKVERCFAAAMTSCAARRLCLEQQISAMELPRMEMRRGGIEQRSDAEARDSEVMPWNGGERNRIGIVPQGNACQRKSMESQRQGIDGLWNSAELQRRGTEMQRLCSAPKCKGAAKKCNGVAANCSDKRRKRNALESFNMNS
jgi:hypothetical protein